MCVCRMNGRMACTIWIEWHSDTRCMFYSERHSWKSGIPRNRGNLLTKSIQMEIRCALIRSHNNMPHLTPSKPEYAMFIHATRISIGLGSIQQTTRHRSHIHKPMPLSPSPPRPSPIYWYRWAFDCTKYRCRENMQSVAVRNSTGEHVHLVSFSLYDLQRMRTDGFHTSQTDSVSNSGVSDFQVRLVKRPYEDQLMFQNWIRYQFYEKSYCVTKVTKQWSIYTVSIAFVVAWFIVF